MAVNTIIQQQDIGHWPFVADVESDDKAILDICPVSIAIHHS
jgi:hypothetical protein